MKKSFICLAALTIIAACNKVESPVVASADYIDEYGVNHGKGTAIGMAVWAPVNCGYHATDFKYGKLYQWGRKYGQGYDGRLADINGKYVGTYADSSVPTIEEGGASAIAVQHKSKANVFFTSTSEYNYDWLYPQNDELWNTGTESAPVKTEYDPCPAGWRIPTYAELDELCKNLSAWTSVDDQPGYWFSGPNSYTAIVPQVFFPAAGFRSSNGRTIGRGKSGAYWSSCPYTSYLIFSNGSIGVSSHGDRAEGNSVRCVQE